MARLFVRRNDQATKLSVPLRQDFSDAECRYDVAAVHPDFDPISALGICPAQKVCERRAAVAPDAVQHVLLAQNREPRPAPDHV